MFVVEECPTVTDICDAEGVIRLPHLVWFPQMGWGIVAVCNICDESAYNADEYQYDKYDLFHLLPDKILLMLGRCLSMKI